MRQQTSKRIEPTEHEIQYTATFNRQWDDYWAVNRPMIQKPSEAAKLEMLQKAIEILPEEVGFEVWNGRRTFKQTDMDGWLLYAVLEGVTSYKPNGNLVFVGLGPWRTGRVRHPDDMPPKFLPPADTWAPDGRRRFCERKADECRAWLSANGNRHPYFRDVKRTLESYLQLLDTMTPYRDEVDEVREQVRRFRTGL